MIIGQKLKELRESKNLSQGDIEQRTGMLRCYTSRVENGHTVPSVETLEKFARALEVPLYQLFYDGTGPIEKPNLPTVNNDRFSWGARSKEHRELRLFTDALSHMNERSRRLLIFIAQKMVRQRAK